MSTDIQRREQIPGPANRIGIEGIEFIEYATHRPLEIGQIFEGMGFQAVARHRSREITLYRQGSMNLIVNAHPEDFRAPLDHDVAAVISGVALRVQDARAAHRRCVELGAWSVASHAQAMELHIPAIRGPAACRFFFVDRWKEFSIYDVDFKPMLGVPQHPPALAPVDYFGLVQYVGPQRTWEWVTYYERMFGFSVVPDEERYGILPRGKLMRSPCGTFYWQLVEPLPSEESEYDEPEAIKRVGLGTPDVRTLVETLRGRGVEFVEFSQREPNDRGALTRSEAHDIAFEIVHRS